MVDEFDFLWFVQWWMENNNNVLGFLGLQLVGLFRVCGLYGVICCSFYLFIYKNLLCCWRCWWCECVCYGGWVWFFVICVVVDGKQQQCVRFFRVAIGGFVGCWWWYEVGWLVFFFYFFFSWVLGLTFLIPRGLSQLGKEHVHASKEGGSFWPNQMCVLYHFQIKLSFQTKN